KKREGEREQRERCGERSLRPDPVGGSASRRAGQERHACIRREDQSGYTERETAHVVEVDEEERIDEAVPERVDDAAELERPDSGPQQRVAPAEVTDDGHRPEGNAIRGWFTNDTAMLTPSGCKIS